MYMMNGFYFIFSIQESSEQLSWQVELLMDVVDSQAYMLPKENAAHLLARKNDFTYHVIPDRSSYIKARI